MFPLLAQPLAIPRPQQTLHLAFPSHSLLLLPIHPRCRGQKIVTSTSQAQVFRPRPLNHRDMIQAPLGLEDGGLC